MNFSKMKYAQLSDWSYVLWNYFVESKNRGRRFYLTVDEYLLSKLSGSIYSVKLSKAEALEHFNSVCNDNLRQSDNAKVGLPFDLSSNGNEYSDAISFAAQQVIAANYMHGDGSYSRNAYYPRYRELLCLPGDGCPMEYKEFARLWDSLKRDLLNFGSYQESDITFKPGGGRDRYRAYPLSQSLFTVPDLRILVGDLPDNCSKESIDGSIFACRNRLSKRGQRLVDQDSLRDEYVSQVSNFTTFNFEEFDASFQSAKKNQKKLTGCLFANIQQDDDDWLSDERYFFFYSSDQNDLRPQNNEDELAAYIDIAFDKFEFLCLVLKEGRYFSDFTNCVLDENDSCIFICTEKSLALLKNQWGEIAIDRVQFTKIETNLSPIIHAVKLASVPSLGGEIEVNQTGVVLKHILHSNGQLSLSGGLCVNAGEKKYLYPYVPDKVIARGNNVHRDSCCTLNDEEILVGEISSYLLKFTYSKTYRLVLDNQCIEFKVVIADRKFEFEWGFPFDSNSQSIEYKISDNLATGSPRLSFWSLELSEKLGASLLVEEQLRMIMCEPESSWVSISPDFAKTVNDELRAYSEESAAISVFLRKIAIQMKMPSRLEAHFDKIDVQQISEPLRKLVW